MLIHHTVDACWECQWTFALSSEGHLLKMMAILEMPLQTRADGALTYMSIKIQQFYGHCGMKSILDIVYSPTGQGL